jgi:hypothetical protein
VADQTPGRFARRRSSRFGVVALQAELAEFEAGAGGVGFADGIAVRGCGHEVDAVDGAGRQAEFAAGAAVGDDGVDALAGADDGVDRAGQDAFDAADAFILSDDGEAHRRFFSAVGIERQFGAIQQRGECTDARRATRRATIDPGFALGDRFGIGPACRIAAARALRLRQKGIDTGDQAGFAHGPIIDATVRKVMTRGA